MNKIEINDGLNEENCKDAIGAHHIVMDRILAAGEPAMELMCPECSQPLKDFKCSKCSAVKSSHSSSMFGGLGFLLLSFGALAMPFFTGFMGFLFAGKDGIIVGTVVGLGLMKILWSDARKTLNRGASLAASSLAMAKRYQISSESYNSAAYCYIDWLKSMPSLIVPEGFLLFLWEYRFYEKAKLRKQLFDLAFLWLQQKWDGDFTPGKPKIASLLAAVYVCSDEQEALSGTLKRLVAEADLQGANTFNIWRFFHYIDKIGGNDKPIRLYIDSAFDIFVENSVELQTGEHIEFILVPEREVTLSC